MGGIHGDLFKFEIAWPPAGNEDRGEEKRTFLARPKKSRYAVTEDEDTPQSRYDTRIQTPWEEEKWVHRTLKQLGRGSFGTVWETVNMHTGDHLAVKALQPSPQQRNDSNWKKMVKREIEIIHGVSHPNLAEFRHCQGFQRDDLNIELFMTLREGSLEALLYSQLQILTDADMILALLQQMLRAVVYLAHNGIVHRDIKPANILYSKSTDKGYQWCLADFGLAKFEDQGLSQVGTGNFRAPEILLGGRQTHKADVYSLAITMLVVVGSESLRRSLRTDERFRESVDFDNVCREARALAPMLAVNPDRRISGQQAYQQFFGEDAEIQSQPPAESRSPEVLQRNTIFANLPGNTPRNANGGFSNNSKSRRRFT